MLIAMMGMVGCNRTPAYYGEYGVELTQDFKNKISESAKAVIASNPTMKAEIEKGLKEMESQAAKVTLSIKEEGKCTISMPDNKTETVDYTFADNKLTIKAPPKSIGAQGNDLVLTWDEAKGTLTAGSDAMGIVFKKK